MALIEKACPACGPGVKLVPRVRRSDKKPFLGCPNWPNCTYTEEMPESVKMRLAGHPVIPGME